MADTERLMNKAQGDDIISALATIAANILQVPSEKLIIDWSYTTLPESGNDHTIYAIPTGDADDPWDFYVWNDVDEEWVQFDWNFAVDSTLSTTSENPVQNKVVTEALNGKVDAVTGKGLSTNDYTNEEKTLVATIPNKADADDVAGTQTASGNPITLTDCAPINAEKLEVELEPKQDLHGHDYPWVGGAGKNKADIHFSITDTYCDSAVSLDEGQYIASLFNKDLTHDGISAGVCFSCQFLDANEQVIKSNIQVGTTLSSSEATQITTLRYWFDRSYYTGTSDEFYGQLETGMTVTSFAPYSNICPITGYTECEVDDVGDNLYIGSPSFDGFEDLTGNWFLQTEKYNGHDVYERGDAWYGCYKLINLPVGTYTFSVMAKTSDGGRIYLFPLLENVTTASVTPQQAYFDTSTSWHRYYYTFNVTVEGTVAFRVERATSGNVYISEYQLEKGTTTPTDYHPYHSSNATIQFGQTVYGGKVDFLTGVLTVDWASVDLGSLDWVYSDGFFKTDGINTTIKRPATIFEFPKVMCERYLSQQWETNYDMRIAVSPSGYTGTPYYLWISDSSYNDAATFKTAMSGVYLVYGLATPTTIQLTPQELKLLKGTNNITTNGTTINLGYQPDNVIGEVKGEIEKCSPNPEFMHFEVNGNVVDAIPIIFDEAIHSYTVSGDSWKDKTFLCVECCDMRYGILQLVLSSDMAFVDSCGKGLLLYPYMRSIEQYIKISISLGQSYGYEISYQTTNTSSLLDYLKIRVRLFN